MAEVDTLISRYVRLLVWQYQLPRAQATAAIVAKVLLMDGLASAVRTAYRVDTALGKQLDVIGKYVGIPRTIGIPTTFDLFGFVDATGAHTNDNGFRSATDAKNANAVFFSTVGATSQATALVDTAYSLMIALQIILNSSDGTLASIQDFLKTLLGNAVSVVDNKNMTLTYTIVGNVPVNPLVLGAYLPKPMGVGIIIKTADELVTDSGDTLVTDSGDTITTTVL